MACECEEYSCLNGFYNPCSEGMELAVISSETGNWTGRVFFNGTSRSFSFGVTNGDNIVVPTELFNESSTQELRIYNSSDSLVGCYQVTTVLDLESGDYPVNPVTPNGLGGKSYIGNGTGTQIFPELNGKELLTIAMGTQEYTSDDWTQSGTSVAWDLEGQLFTGTIVLTWQNS